MIVCTQCGFTNADDDQFCGGCREFLEWTGERVDAPVDEPAPAVDPDDRGLVRRVVDTLSGHHDDDGQAGGSGDARTPGPAGSGSSDSALPDPVRAAAERAHRAADEAEQARRAAAARAAEQAEATAAAQVAAQEAAAARVAADAQARDEAAEADRLRARLADARQARERTEAELEEEVTRAEQDQAAARRRREDAEQQATQEHDRAADAERERAAARQRLAQEEAELAQVREELTRVEAARQDAEERARTQAEAAEEAARLAEAAEDARREADERAAAEARAAEQASRAAAMVARPRPATPDSPGTPSTGAGPATTGTTGSAGSGPGPSRPTGRPRRRPDPDARSSTQPPASSASPDDESSPGPVRPDRQRVRRSTANVEPTAKLRPGDLVCGQCGTGNAPERRFCRTCGESLAESTVVTRPWWQRLVPRRTPAAAGTRPSTGKRRGLAKGARGAKRGVLGAVGTFGRWLTIALMVSAALGIALVPDLRDAASERFGSLTTAVRRIVAPEFVPVRPIGTTASSQVMPDHPAGNATNDTLNRWWAARPDDGRPTLTVTFGEPVDIAVIGVIPGAAEPTEYDANPRPRTLHLVFDTGATVDLDIVDNHEFQTFDVDGADQVTSVVVEVTDTWQGQGGGQLSLTSLQFRTVR